MAMIATVVRPFSIVRYYVHGGPTIPIPLSSYNIISRSCGWYYITNGNISACVSIN